jgi:hypothetical protein
MQALGTVSRRLRGRDASIRRRKADRACGSNPGLQPGQLRVGGEPACLSRPRLWPRGYYRDKDAVMRRCCRVAWLQQLRGCRTNRGSCCVRGLKEMLHLPPPSALRRVRRDYWAVRR